jgi:hypothetical protein
VIDRDRVIVPLSSRIARDQLTFYSKYQPAGNGTGKRRSILNPVFTGRIAPLFAKQGANLQLPMFRYFAIGGSALLVLLFVSEAYLSDDGAARFDGSLYDTATYVPKSEATLAVAELRFTHDASPADHIRDVFAQFVADEGRRKKR